MRRGIFTDRERSLKKSIRAEHELFKYKMLASPVREVYEDCSRIRFYECIFEYFEYNDNISSEIMDACLKEQNVINALWGTYVNNEYLKYDTWEDISELVMVLMQRRACQGGPS